MEKGTFPKQYKLGPRAVGWLESDIEKWIEQRCGQPGVTK
jgi:prophage regulatory protein